MPCISCNNDHNACLSRDDQQIRCNKRMVKIANLAAMMPRQKCGIATGRNSCDIDHERSLEKESECPMSDA